MYINVITFNDRILTINNYHLFNSLSLNAWNLDQSKILLFCKEVNKNGFQKEKLLSPTVFEKKVTCLSQPRNI